METALSVHKITKNMVDDKILPFDTTVYSKFKYGSTKDAAIMAREMAALFINYDQKYNIIDIDTKVCIASPAHKRVPSAANKLAEDIYLMLNWYLHSKDYDAAEQLRVYREAVYDRDYATLNEEERIDLLSTEKLSVNEEKVKDKFIIFVDDIRVTGTHEMLVENMIKTYPHSNHLHLYYAECEDGIGPDIENKLNKAYVDNPTEMIGVLQNEHILNARMIKDILRFDAGTLTKFVRSFPDKRLFINIVNSCIAEGYDKIAIFKPNFTYLKNIVRDELYKSKETACNQS